MRRRLRNAILLVAALTCLAPVTVIAALLLIVPRPEFQRWLGERLTGEMGPGFAFSSVSIAFWPKPGLRFRGVSLGDGVEGAGGRGLAARSVGCTLRVASLLDGEVVVDGIFVEKPSLSIERDPGGKWIVGATLRRLLSRAASEKPAELASERAPRAPPHLAIRGGELEIDDRSDAGTPVQFRIERLDVDFDPPGPERSGRMRIAADGAAAARLEVDATIEPMSPGVPLTDAPFEAEVHGESLGSDDVLRYLLFGLPIRNAGGRFDIAGSVSRRTARKIEGSATIDVPHGFVDAWGVGVGTPMRLAASFDVEKGRFSMHQARLRAPSISFSRFAGENPTAVFDWSSRNLRVDAFDFGAYEGTWKTKGSVFFGDEPGFQVEVRAKEVALRDLFRAFTGDEAQRGFETLSAEGAFRGRWTGPDVWLATLSGFGHATLAGGRIESSPVVRSIFAALLGRIPGFSRFEIGGSKGRPTELERLTASFTVRDSRVMSDDVDFRTSDYHMKGRGRVGFDGSLDGATEVAFTARGVETLYVLAARPFRERGDRSLPSVPVKLSGTLAHPAVTPDVSGLPLAPFRMLFGGAKSLLP